MLLSFVSLQLVSHPYDRLVATSYAGAKVVTQVFNEAKALLVANAIHPVQPTSPMVTHLPLGSENVVKSAPSKQECRDLLGIPVEAIVILYVGRFSQELKADLDPLIATVSCLSRDYKDVFLILAGQAKYDTYVDAVSKALDQFGLTNSARVIADFPTCNKAFLYKAADIFVSPVDNIQETFGIAILEAMSAGLPVLAADWSGYRDLVQHGRTGFLIRTIWSSSASQMVTTSPRLRGSQTPEHYLAERTIVDIKQLYEYLKALITNPALRQQLGEAGHARFEAEFSWKVVIQRYVALWTEQAALAGQNSPEQRQYPQLDYNTLFGHYATQTLSGKECVQRSRVADNKVLSLLEHCSPAMSPLLKAAVEGIYTRCEPDKTVAIKELTGDVNDTVEEDAITWLLKKGWLQLSDTV